MLIKYLFVSIILLYISTINFVLSQSPNFVFERITDKNGRSFGQINKIVQDNNGFMWFATKNGLLRYDGYNTKIFKKNTDNPASIPFTNVTDMYYDNSGYLWLRHAEYFVVFKNEKVHEQHKKITSQNFGFDAKIHQDTAGNIWIGASKTALIRYKLQTDTLEYFQSKSKEYNQSYYQLIDSFNTQNKSIASISTIKNSMLERTKFSISRKTKVLVICSGEIDENQKFDYGTIMCHDKLVWQMSYAESAYNGGYQKNMIQAQIIELDKGEFELSYLSDEANSPELWVEAKPDKSNFSGIKLFEINDKNFKHLENQLNLNNISGNGISSSTIFGIFQNDKKQICILNQNGFDIFNPNSNRFLYYQIDFTGLEKYNYSDFLATSLIQFSDSIYWIGSSLGMIEYNVLSKKWILSDIEFLQGKKISCMFKDKDNFIWIGTENGLYSYNPNQRKTNQYVAPEENLYSNKITSIYQDKSGILWVGTVEGLNKISKSKFTYANLRTENYKLFPFFFDNNNRLNYQAKRNLFSILEETRTSIKYIELPDRIFPYNEATKDRWYKISEMLHINNKTLLAIGNNIYQFDSNNETITKEQKLNNFNIFEETLIDNIFKLFEKSNNECWVFSTRGIYIYNLEKNTFTEIVNHVSEIGFIYQFDKTFLKFVLKDSNGNFWLRTTIGVYYFNQNSIKKVLSFSDEIIETSVTDGNLLESKDGHIWLSVFPNICELASNKVTPTIYHLTIDEEIGQSNIFLDKDNFFWLYSENGLIKLDHDFKPVNKFKISEGLADNSVNGMIDDGNGNIWISTLKGLSKYNKSQNTFDNYFTSSDLSPQHFIGISDVNFIKKGEILFFTKNGLVGYQLNNTNQNIPEIALTKINLFGQELEFDEPVYNLKHIDLKYNQNYLTFEFSALDFNNSDKNQYAYILEGLDKDWFYCDANNRKASYTSLPPGSYTLKIKASNNDGVWNETGISLSIIIAPPWWRTIWAYILYVITLVVIFGIYVKLRERKLVREKNILEQKVLARTAEIEKQKNEIGEQKQLAEEQRDRISQQKKSITDSIEYASRIQRAVLPRTQILEHKFSDYFILNLPRDIVSGDFYWFGKRENKYIILAADGTGHGVPGAFMSMLGVAFLNEIVSEIQVNFNAADILNELRDMVIKSMHQTGSNTETKDGMDIALCVLDFELGVLDFAGANNPLFVIRDNVNSPDFFEFKADRMPIGIYHKISPFKNQKFEFRKGDCLYMFTDGYVDQFGSEKNRKFMSKKLQEILIENYKLPMQDQYEIVRNAHFDWKGNLEQIDDILLIGFRI